MSTMAEKHTVLLCYDGSESAVMAIRRAASLLRPRAAIVAHVRDAPEELAEAGRRVAVEAGFDPVSATELDGDRVATAIIEAAHVRGAEVIVVGSWGATAVGSLLLGSVSSALVHRADVPVLVVRPEIPGVTDDSGPTLLGYDGSDVAGDAIVRAGELLADRDAIVASFIESIDDVVVLRSTFPWPAGPELHDRLARLSRGEAERLSGLAADGASEAAAAGLAARQVPLQGQGPAWARLLDASVRQAASCIVVGHRQPTMHLGSTAYGLVHHADRPVLVIPGPA
jgi:nucleotide-binding universal stress UspA family protein